MGSGFRIWNALAAGGMGVVYLGTHARMPGWFAIKAPRRDAVALPETTEALRQEAMILRSINHRNVVRGFGFGITDGGIPYLVMEYLPGRDLAQLLRGGVLAPRRTAAIINEVAAGLAAAHARGIVHCDLKPSNIVMVAGNGGTDAGAVKLVDFGVSQGTALPGVFADSGVAGTPDYMAPERASGSFDNVSARSDQFSLAVTAYEMMTGRLPFPGPDARSVMHRIVHQPPLPLGEDLGFPAHATDAVIRRGLHKDPDARFATVTLFARALEAALRADTADFRLGSSPVEIRLRLRPIRRSLIATVENESDRRAAPARAAAGAG